MGVEMGTQVPRSQGSLDGIHIPHFPPPTAFLQLTRWKQGWGPVCMAVGQIKGKACWPFSQSSQVLVECKHDSSLEWSTWGCRRTP